MISDIAIQNDFIHFSTSQTYISLSSPKAYFNETSYNYYQQFLKLRNRKMEKAVLAGGCFWCIEALLKNLKGVSKVTPGYCGGQNPFPKYSQVKSGKTNHLQVVQIIFDSQVITFEQIFQVFMNIHDPTQEDGQGQDIGTQYTSAIFYQGHEQLMIANKIIDRMSGQARISGKRIYTVVRQGMPFYEAEQYHKNYFELKGSQNPYCSIIPGKIAKMKYLFKQLCA